MLTIYAIPISLYCAKLRILLRHKGLDWNELPPPGGYGSDEYKLTIPSGNLPAMIDEGLTLADSEVIAEYLNEKFPQPAMLPDDLRQKARVRERSRFHDTRLEPELRKLFPYIDEKKAPGNLIKQQCEHINARLKQLSIMLEHPHCAYSESLTLGDCGLPVTFVWINALTPVFDLDIDWPETVIDYKNQIESHSAVAKELETYVNNLSQWLNSVA